MLNLNWTSHRYYLNQAILYMLDIFNGHNSVSQETNIQTIRRLTCCRWRRMVPASQCHGHDSAITVATSVLTSLDSLPADVWSSVTSAPDHTYNSTCSSDSECSGINGHGVLGRCQCAAGFLFAQELSSCRRGEKRQVLIIQSCKCKNY